MLLQGVNYVPINVLANSVEANGSLESMMTAGISTEKMMSSIYANLVSTVSAKKSYHEFLALLLGLEGQPVIFHCSAGKDRTGFATALVLRLLGASMEAIYTDYLLTNQQRTTIK